MNFIKQIATGKTNKEAHSALIRYGPGSFVRDNLIIKKEKNTIKLAGGLDFVNIFQRFTARYFTEDVDISGAIPTAREILPILESYGIEAEAKVRRKKLGKRYEFKKILSPKQTQELIEELFNCYLLLDMKSGNCSVKIKKKETPKIAKPAPRFVTAVLPIDALKDVIAEFLFDVDLDGFKRAVLSHTFVIEKVILDPKLDPERARLDAKRKGILKRKIIIDKKETEKEYKFEV